MSAGQFDCQDDWCGGEELPVLENYYLINRDAKACGYCGYIRANFFF